MRFFIPLFFLVIQPLVAGDAPVWPHAFMEAEPATLLAAAKEQAPDLPNEDGLTMLALEERVEIGPDGRRTHILRETYQITRYEGLQEYGALEAEWRPWYQDRPRFRARIIRPNGESHQLQQGDVVESAADDAEKNQFSEDRRLRAPLPHLVVGAVIEAETITPGVRPFFRAGDAWAVHFRTAPFPQKVVVSVPENTALSHAAEADMVLDHEVRQENGRAVHTWRLVTPPPEIDLDAFLSKGTFTHGRLSLATGASWQAVGAAYATLVDNALANQNYPFDLQSWVVPGDNRATAIRFNNELDPLVRYTGLYLGDKDLVPTAPDVVLQRGYGDCKDKATLLTGMLRQVGIAADVALVNGSGHKIEPKTPGLGAFDHAIVVVPREDGTRFWVDPTVPLNRTGALPFRLHGSLALIADPENQGLVRIGPAVAEEHGVRFDLQLDLRRMGTGTTTANTLPRGNSEANFRSEFRDMVNDFDGTPDAQGVSTSVRDMVAPIDLRRPWTRAVTFANHPGLVTTHEGAELQVPVHWLLDHVPVSLGHTHDEAAHEALVYEAGVYTMDYTILVPRDFEVVTPFKELDFKTEHVRFSTESETPNRGRVVLRFEAGRYGREEVTAVRAFLKAISAADFTQSYKHKGLKRLAEEAMPEAFALLREARDQAPDAMAHFRLGQALMEVGLLEPALTEIEQGLAYEYNVAEALYAASVAAHNYFGQELGPAFVRPRTIKIIDTALAAFPDDPHLQTARALAENLDGNGMLSLDREVLDRSYAFLKEGTFAGLESESQVQVLLNRFFARDYETLAKLTAAVEPPVRLLFELAMHADQGRLAETFDKVNRVRDPRLRLMLLVQASDLVSRNRNYPASIALLERVNMPEARALLEKRRRFMGAAKPVALDGFKADDPTTPLYKLLANLCTVGADKPFGNDEIFFEEDETTLKAVQTPYAGIAHQLVLRGQEEPGLNQRTITDILVSNVSMTFVDGLPEETRARGRVVKMALALDEEGGHYFWVLPSADGYRIASLLAWGGSLGKGLRHAVGAGREADITALMKVLLDPQNADAFRFIKIKGLDETWNQLNPEGETHYGLAAALLGPAKALTRKELKELTAFADGFEPGELKDRILQQVAAGWVARGKAKKGATLYETWYREQPEHGQGVVLMRLYHQAGMNAREAELLAELETAGEDGMMLRHHKVERLLDSRDYKRILEEMNAAADHKISSLMGAANDVAWLYLFIEGASMKEAIKMAESSVVVVDPTQGRVRASGPTLHTLATLHATDGNIGKALEMLREMLSVERRFVPEDEDWYVLGLIARQIGFAETAKTYFERVPVDESAVSTYQLAQMRLAESTKPPATPQKAKPAKGGTVPR
ncbi:DUF3857 domain-containing protein [Acanthopleuribacter pedis]|uniref:DUF3857 domain-containing protein n=1 Tax=Acanthopleuribacter pedis TaxID=442870 RepID=A0A8J7U7L0_9BACT|nr:DUF3857 domain-containing protein [Acanthopleuribacter pedis]MBO1323114.1 DUF3857 domain-containing protein [Acanthopleuribacter pedis]